MKVKIIVFVFLLSLIFSISMAVEELIDPKGRPALPANNPASFIVWKSYSSWHIRWVSTGEPHTYSGEVVANGGTLRKVSPLYPQSNKLKLKNSDRRIRFKSVDIIGFDGFDIKTDARKLKFKLKINGNSCRECIYIGKHSQNPRHSYFTLFSAR